MRTEHKWAVVGALIAIAALVYILNIYSGTTQPTGELPFENRPAVTTGTTPGNTRTAATPTPAGASRDGTRSVFNNTGAPAQPANPNRGVVPTNSSTDPRTPGLPPLRSPTGGPPPTGNPGLAANPTGPTNPATANPGGSLLPPPRPADTGSPFAPRPGATTDSPRVADRSPGGAVDPTIVLPDPTPSPRGNVITPPRRADPDEAADASQPPSNPRLTGGGTPSPRGTPGVPLPPTEGGPPQSDMAQLVNPSGAPAGTGAYTIREADTLSSISREHYGDDRYWKAIVAANPGLEPNRLFVGKTITLPPKEAVLAGRSGKPAPAKPGTARNDTPAAAPQTADARNNRGRANAEPTTNERRTDRVAGTSVRQDATPADTAPKAGRATYRVGSGDSLISIARNVLKDENRWREIYELNKDRLKSPDALPAGVELKLPETTSSRPGSSKGKG